MPIHGVLLDRYHSHGEVWLPCTLASIRRGQARIARCVRSAAASHRRWQAFHLPGTVLIVPCLWSSMVVVGQFERQFMRGSEGATTEFARKEVKGDRWHYQVS